MTSTSPSPPSLEQGATVVCVLGMSRSGTSLTTRILNLCGVYLGSEDDLLGPMSVNPEGFWEHHRIMRLNEGILKSLGGSWREPPEMPPGWEDSPELGPARERAVELLEETFAGRRLWGWKDPRNCLTLPFWQRLLPQMRYVICLRNPVDVAASLERREHLLADGDLPPDGIGAERAFRLWLEYLASAIANTAGRPRVFVSYEEYFDDWRSPVERLARFVGRDPAALGAGPRRQTEAAINDRLRHHRSSPAEAVGDPRLPPEVAALYLIAEQLRGLGAAAPGAPAGRLAELHDAADRCARRLLAGTAGSVSPAGTS